MQADAFAFESPRVLSLFPTRLFHDDFLHRPLVITTNDVLLDPTYWPHHRGSQHTETRSDELPRQHEQTEYSELADELYPLVDLIKVILTLDIVAVAFVGMVRCRVWLGNELKDRGQFNVGTEEWKGPKTEQLSHRNVEPEFSLIIS